LILLLTSAHLAHSAAKDLPKLSALGHFLKGSSAALGVTHVQASCEKIQHLGQQREEPAKQEPAKRDPARDEPPVRELSPQQALDQISMTLRRVKGEYALAERWLKSWFEANSRPEL